MDANPVFLLTPLGEVEFTKAVELRVFRKEWTRGLGPFTICFCNIKPPVCFALRLGSEIWASRLQFEQSQLGGAVLSPKQLRRLAADDIPQLSSSLPT